MQRWLTDGVWRQLDRRAGQLSRWAVIRLWIAVAVATVLGLGATVAWNSGVIVSQLTWSNDGLEWNVPRSGPVSFNVRVRNSGLVPVTVVGAGRSGPGMDLVHVTGEFPTTLEPGEAMTVVVVYRITDCAAMPKDDWPVPVRVSRFWGEETAYLQGEQPFVDPWQRLLHDTWCVEPGSPAHPVA